MREAGAVEIELHVVGFRPVDPALEMFRLDLVAVPLLAAEIAVDGMDAQAVRTGDQALGLLDILAYLLDITGLAGIVTGSLDTARKLAVRVFETGYVIRLPAVQREGDILQFLQCLVGIDPDLCIALFGGLVSLDDLCFFHSQFYG